MGGFTYCGRRCDEFGVQYAPKDAQKQTRIAPYEQFSKDVPGKHGGYYYGNRVPTRIFEMPCLIDGIDDAAQAQTFGWLNRNSFGELEFDDRPGMKYWARPSEIADPKLYKHSSFGEPLWFGTFMVTMTAHHSFAHMERIGVEDAAMLDANQGFLRNHTGMLPMSIVPALNHSGLIGQTKTLLLYNPGNERVYLNIVAAGDVCENGLLIYNRNTDQRCKIIHITKAETVDIDAHLEIDAEHGKVYMVRYGAKTLAFPYHDEGYIQLEGAHPIERDIAFSYIGNEREIHSDKPFRLDHVGKYVYLHAGWIRINSVKSLNTATVDFTFSHSGMEISDIVTMNEIVLTGSPGLTLDHLLFDYRPLFS